MTKSVVVFLSFNVTARNQRMGKWDKFPADDGGRGSLC